MAEGKSGRRAFPPEQKVKIAGKKQPGVFVVSGDWLFGINLKPRVFPGFHVFDSVLVDELLIEKSFEDFVS